MSSKFMHILASDPGLLLHLCEDLNDKSGTAIQVKVNTYLETQTGAKLVFLVPLMNKGNEAVIQVLGTTVLEHEMRFPVANNILCAAIKRRSSVISETTLLHLDLLNILRSRIHPIPTTFLSVPISHPETNEIALLVCLANHKTMGNANLMCTRIVQECFRFCLGTVVNSLAYEEEKRLKIENQQLLLVAKNLFMHLGNINQLLQEIMLEARKLTNAERCSLFLVDPNHQELVAKVFDGLTTDAVKDVRLAAGTGIAGHVAATGEVVNLRDVYKHPLFFKGMDEATGFVTRNMLCFPIRDDKGIIGVAQLCNKVGGFHFDVFDEEVAVAFSVYCGVSIMHSLVYKKIQDAQARNKLSNELMIYHMKVTDSDVRAVTTCKKSHKCPIIANFAFSGRLIPVKESPCYVLWMFQDLDLVKPFNIHIETLVRFTLYIRKGYRDTPYHNWMHAFSMFHTGYLLVKNLKIMEREYLSRLECLVLLVSCLCHDLDHRGTNNSFQVNSANALASLYSSEGSVMERHHLAQAMCILNTEGCNVFDHLPRAQYTECLAWLKSMILATDLASHFSSLGKQRQMAEVGYNKDNEHHKELLTSLLMTSCDLSDQTKNYTISKSTSELVYTEFFSQGDLEKSMGKMPIEMMDREKARIPVLQIQFFDAVLIPLYTVLVKLFPEAQCILDAVEKNKAEWATQLTDIVVADTPADVVVKGQVSRVGSVSTFFEGDEQ